MHLSTLGNSKLNFGKIGQFEASFIQYSEIRSIYILKNETKFNKAENHYRFLPKIIIFYNNNYKYIV